MENSWKFPKQQWKNHGNFMEFSRKIMEKSWKSVEKSLKYLEKSLKNHGNL